jgi:hypothetical protein
MLAAYESYINVGFSLVPIVSGKGPVGLGWNARERCVTDISKLNDTIGVGLAHAYSGTMALDIDEWDKASEFLATHDIDLKSLFDAPDSVTINSGNPGHAKLLYRMPFGMSLTSKKLIYVESDGMKKNYLDFRCATASGLTVQDVLPSAVRHPITCQPYSWGGNGHYTNLPAIPEALLALWQSLLTKDTERSISVKGSPVDASWDEIKQALDHINPDISRDEWVQIGMALHYAGTATQQLDQALTVWNDWSANGSKYKGEKDILTCWKSFTADDTGVKLGTLFHYARDAGWVRPLPDVTYMFSEVTASSPKSIIDGLVIHPPVCDIDLFPEVLTNRAKVIARAFAADPLVPIFAGLGAIQAAVDQRTRLHLMDGWEVPPILWTMTVGSPSAKKTPAATPMLEILAKLEKEDLPRYRQEFALYEALEAAYAASKKAYLQAAADPNHMLGGNLDVAALPTVAAQPIAPVALRMTVGNITSQKLARMAIERPRGLLCHLDEMRSWADKLSDKGSGEDRSTWVQSYEGKEYKMDRVGDGDLCADHLAVGILGNMQPHVLTEKLPMLISDGLIQRFIFAVISDHHSDKLNDPSAIDPIGQLQYEEAIRAIYALPVTTYRLSEGAYTAFRAYQEWFLILKKDERITQASNVYMEAIGKVEGTTGRLMLLLHLITDPHAIEVSADTAVRAIRLVQGYIVPAMRYVYGNIEGIDASSLDKWVLDHVLYVASQASTITLSELRRSARQQIKGITPQRADLMLSDAMGILESNGWVSLLEQNQKTTKWAINPAIKDIDKDYRQTVIDARQRIYDHIHATSGGKAPRRIAKG